MSKKQKPVYWKKPLICISSFVLFYLIQTVAASNEDSKNEQAVFTTSIEKAKSVQYNEGQHLYEEALKQLKIVEKAINESKQRLKKSTNLSQTDRIIRKVIDMWHSKTKTKSIVPADTTKHKNLENLRKSEFDAIALMLEKSAREYQNNDALLLLAELNFFSKYNFPRNYHSGFEYYSELASRGNATAQQMIGFMYSTGVGNVVKRDNAKALLYQTFAAYGGDIAAELTMGNRFLFGIGTDESCDDALYHYKNVARKVAEYYISGPPGGHTLPFLNVRLSEENGGVYGSGASVVTEKKGRNQGGSEKSVSMAEIIQYWRYLASKQEMEAQIMLGQLYYVGTRNVERNFKEALFFFHQIVEKYSSSGKLSAKHNRIVGQAAGYLGLMHWRGEGVEVDEEKAYEWFKIGSELGDSNAQNYLGMMYLEGKIVHANKKMAIDLFKKSADQGNSNAQVNLAIEYIQTDPSSQIPIFLFTKAAEARNILGHWYLGQLNEKNLGSRSSCEKAVKHYKAAVEIGDWLDPIVEEGYNAYKNGDRENALLYYMLGAERGYEVAQSNVAYLLDEDKNMLHAIPFIESLINTKQTSLNEVEGLDKKETAFIYWTRSANQKNVDSLVKIADYYYKGIGTKVDLEKAANCYRHAAEVQSSPLAFWNLGWVYENGIGVSKDFHLAKRAYDQALSLDQDAYLPIKLSLIKLYAKYYWEWLMGYEVGPALKSESEKADNQDFEFKSKNEADKKQYDIGQEMERQYKMKKQQERDESERLIQGNTHDFDSDETSGILFENELLESVFTLALCFLVAYLVYVRQFHYGGNNNRGMNAFLPNNPLVTRQPENNRNISNGNNNGNNTNNASGSQSNAENGEGIDNNNDNNNR